MNNKDIIQDFVKNPTYDNILKVIFNIDPDIDMNNYQELFKVVLEILDKKVKYPKFVFESAIVMFNRKLALKLIGIAAEKNNRTVAEEMINSAKCLPDDPEFDDIREFYLNYEPNNVLSDFIGDPSRENLIKAISSIPANINLVEAVEFIRKVYDFLAGTEKYPQYASETMLLKYNEKFFKRMVEFKTSSSPTEMLKIYNQIFNTCGEDHEFKELSDFYFSYVLLDQKLAKEFMEDLLRKGSLNRIKQHIDLIPLNQFRVFFHGARNKNIDVNIYCFERLSSDVELKEKYICCCGDNLTLIKLIGKKYEITESMAGCAINNMSTVEDLQDLIQYLKEKNVNVSKAIRNYRDGEKRSAIDNACWIPKPKLLPILIANTTDEDLKVILTTKNYSYRTPLGHCSYYNFKDCIDIINTELTRLKIKDDYKNGVLRVVNIG